MELDRIDELVKEYLLDVMSSCCMTIEDLEDTNNDNYNYEKLKFEACNLYDEELGGGHYGSDFVEWYTRKGYSTCDILEIGTMTTLYLKINEYFEENYGKTSVMNWKTFSPENVLLQYVYFYLHGYLSKEELVAVLKGEDLYIYIGEDKLQDKHFIYKTISKGKKII